MSTEKQSQQGYRSILTGFEGELQVQRLFAKWEWLPRKQDALLDQGIDLIVEIGEHGRGAGVHFGVQCKATASAPKFTNDGISVVLKKSTVEYFMKQSLPMLLMFATVKGEQVYWIDAIRAIKASSPKSDGSVLVKIPKERCLCIGHVGADLEADRESVLRAVQLRGVAWSMPNLRLEERIAIEEAELAACDPALTASIAVTRNGRVVTITPRTPHSEVSLQASIQFESQEDRNRMRETFEFGVRSEVDVTSFRLDGSPLMDRLLPVPRPGKLVVAAKSAGLIRARVRPGGGRGGGALGFEGHLTRGAVGSNANLASPSHPLTANIRINAVQRNGAFHVDFDPSLWSGRTLVPLEKLVDTAESVEAIAKARSMRASFRFKGADLHFLGDASEDAIEGMLQAAAALRDLDDLRELAFRYEPELAIGDLRHCGPGEGYWWHVARQLLDGVVVEVGVRSAEFTTDLDRDPSFFKDGVFLMSAVPHQVMAFGKLLCEIPVDVYLQGYVATCARDGDGLLRIKIAKSQGSVARWRLASSEPLEEFDPTHSSRKL